jgi:hypothetical protein
MKDGPPIVPDAAEHAFRTHTKAAIFARLIGLNFGETDEPLRK